MPSLRLALSCLLLPLALLSACGDEETAPSAIECNPTLPVYAEGNLGGLAVNYQRSEQANNLNPAAPVGERSSRRIAVLMGELTPEGEDAPLPLILSLQTNTVDPGGSNLAENVLRRLDEGDGLEVVEKPLDQYCDPEAGQLCARVGLDDTQAFGLTDEAPLVHPATEGEITIQAWTSTRVTLTWDLTLGPALKGGGDEGGALKGCLDAQIGLTQDGVDPLRVIP